MRKIFILKLFFLFVLSFCFAGLSATHNRAGELSYIQLSDLTYEITITTYTYTLSFADRPTLEVEWGDNTKSTAERISILTLPNYYKRNIYKVLHTYPGPSIYTIVVQDPNRNADVQNIPSSVNVVFSISTILTVNPSMGFNQTPVLLNPPYDKAAFGHVFIHNPAAYDLDGDSLSYKLKECTREDGKPIIGYTFPPASKSFTVDAVTGDLIWDTPSKIGIFNVAMEIQEWRNGKKIGMVVRDMQIQVYETDNNPPVNKVPDDFCVEAGDTCDFLFSATDTDDDNLTLKSTSGIFTIGKCPATFTKVDSVPGYASSQFRWRPCFEAVRSQAYDIIFKSDDNNDDVSLSDIDNLKIKVLGPSPVIINAIPEGKLIRLTWSVYGTTAIAGFSIYRKEGASTFIPDSCTAGIPSSTGFVKVGYTGGSSVTSFSDSDNGEGLQFGTEYTYRIVAIFPNGTESKASNEITSALVSGVPIIKNVSVIDTDVSSGSIFISWKKPMHLDTIPANGPYKYRIARALGTGGTDYTQIDSIFTTDLNDTTLVDSSINTRETGYIYRIELWNNETGNSFLIGEPGYASSVYLSVAPGDRKARLSFARNVPWINTRYDILRLNESTMDYDSVGSTNQLSYTDPGLENGKDYCYLVRSFGGYLADDMPKELVNFSEIQCLIPVDNEPPCQPSIDLASQCDSLYNTVLWNITDSLCLDDIAGYRIYFKPPNVENLSFLTEIPDKYISSFKHYPGEIIAGCYAVSAFDSKGNEGKKSVTACIDSCDFYEIPNVFTPNGDDINDRLVAKASGLVEKVDFRLFNRNGMLLFTTEEPSIEWDGTYKGKIVSPGVYFYQCDVYENRIDGMSLRHISGFVHVITTMDAKIKKVETK